MDFDYSVEHFYKTFIMDDAKFSLKNYNAQRGKPLNPSLNLNKSEYFRR